MRKSVLGIVGMVGLVSVLAGALGCSGNGGGGSGGNGSGGSAGSSGGQAAGGRGGNGSGGTVGGAGGSSGGQGGNGGSAIASCNAYCDAYIAAACPTPFYTSANECKSAECGDISKIASAACLATVTTFYDCERTQADICGDAGCTNEFTAVITACS